MKVVIEIEARNPEIVAKSLSIDNENNKNASISIKIDKEKLKITIKGDKPSHIKGIVNSYLTLINILNEME